MTKRSLFDNSLTLTILFGFSWVNQKGGGSGRVAFSGVLALKGAKSAGLFKLMSGYKMRRFFFTGLASGLSDSVFSSFCVFSLMQALEQLKLLISSSHFLRFSLIFLYFSTLPDRPCTRSHRFGAGFSTTLILPLTNCTKCFFQIWRICQLLLKRVVYILRTSFYERLHCVCAFKDSLAETQTEALPGDI